MTAYTINDSIFQPLRDASGADPAALQALINALNQNSYANAAFTQAVQRGDFVFELVDHDTLASNGAGALYSNDRGTDAFIKRENKFAIQLDKDWFVPQDSNPATFTKNSSTTLGMLIQEADHSNRQATFDEAFKIAITPSYLPSLTGAARVAASVDATMKAEVAGWYAELQTVRADLERGHLDQFKYDLYTKEGTSFGKLLAVEAQGKALGLSGEALTNYVSDHGKQAIPSDYVDRYMSSYITPGINPADVRALMPYAQTSDPLRVKSYSAEVGPDGVFNANTTYNNGDQLTYIDTGLSCRVIETDSAFNDADYSTRTFMYDSLGRHDWTAVYDDHGGYTGIDYDQNNERADSIWQIHIDGLGRTDWIATNEDDGSYTGTDYDQNNERDDSIWQIHLDAQGREDWKNVTYDDGRRLFVDLDQANATSLSSVHHTYDAQGRETDFVEFNDAGGWKWVALDYTGIQSWSSAHHTYDAQGRETDFVEFNDAGGWKWVALDYTGSQSWSSVHHTYDAQGRETDFVEFNDAGGWKWVALDYTGSQSWSSVHHTYDAQGRETDFVEFNDAGGWKWVALDYTGTQSWSSVHHTYDAQGRETDFVEFNDSGGWNWVALNYTGSQPWSSVHHLNDAQGREDFNTSYLNDGRRTVIDFDQNGSQTWSSTVTNYDASGRKATQTQYHDNGDRSERTYFPEQNPNAFSEQYIYADGHGAGGKVLFDGYNSRLLIGGSDMAGEFVGSPHDLWLRVGVTYYFEEPDALVIVGPIEGPFDSTEGW